MDDENINEIIAPFNLHVYDENPSNVRGSLIYYPDGEYRLGKCLTPEKRRDLREEMATGIWHPGILKNA